MTVRMRPKHSHGHKSSKATTVTVTATQLLDHGANNSRSIEEESVYLACNGCSYARGSAG